MFSVSWGVYVNMSFKILYLRPCTVGDIIALLLHMIKIWLGIKSDLEKLLPQEHVSSDSLFSGLWFFKDIWDPLSFLSLWALYLIYLRCFQDLPFNYLVQKCNYFLINSVWNMVAIFNLHIIRLFFFLTEEMFL